jgi:4-amino-4-deoxy-L-arabinose transferase-like glycosyltransferase
MSTATLLPAPRRWPWWLEREFLLLALLVFAVYFLRLTDLSIRGEESRWAHVACEMLRTGDWVVSRQQGKPFFSRPPLGCWVIALATLARGECDLTAVRLPTFLATLLTTLLIYGYSRSWMPRLGALSAGAAYATLAHVLELGRLAETEATFTFLVGGSLLVWHWGHLRGARWGWLGGFLLAALAALTKGPQAPVYFGASVGVCLLVTGQWRQLFGPWCLLGVLLFSAVLGAWQVPFFRALGWQAVRQTWASDTGMRFAEHSWGAFLNHLGNYPAEVLACTLPWSPLLFFFASRRLRAALGPAALPVLFLTICLVVTFPTCWLVPGARGRYFMPLYPCLAVLAGVVVQRCAEADLGSALRRAWNGYVLAWAALMVGGVVLVLGATFAHFPRIPLLDQPPAFAAVYAVAGVGLAALMVWSCRGARHPGVAVLALAGFFGLTSAGVVMNDQIRKSVDARPAMSALAGQLPPGRQRAAHDFAGALGTQSAGALLAIPAARKVNPRVDPAKAFGSIPDGSSPENRSVLVSFGPVHSLFLYYYRDPIEERPWPSTPESAADVTWFCFDRWGACRPNLPFAWEEVAVINCDRYQCATPECCVVVGRRLPASPTPPVRVEARVSHNAHR